jgi:Zn-finger nucleic acid-binding protein
MIPASFTCPKCRKPSLSEFNTSEGVVVDFCVGCKGIWFDKNELAHYIELSQDIPELMEMKKVTRQTGLTCPKCGSRLDEIPFSSRTQFLVERCEACGGVFLDAGELPEVEKASAELERIEARMKLVVKRFAESGYEPLNLG